MAKRGLQDVDEDMDTKAQYGQRRTLDDGDVEMGEFEDPWEDEIEEDEEIIEGEGEEDEEDEDKGCSAADCETNCRNAGCTRGWRGLFTLQSVRERSCVNAGFICVRYAAFNVGSMAFLVVRHSQRSTRGREKKCILKGDVTLTIVPTNHVSGSRNPG